MIGSNVIRLIRAGLLSGAYAFNGSGFGLTAGAVTGVNETVNAAE